MECPHGLRRSKSGHCVKRCPKGTRKKKKGSVYQETP